MGKPWDAIREAVDGETTAMPFVGYAKARISSNLGPFGDY